MRSISSPVLLLAALSACQGASLDPKVSNAPKTAAAATKQGNSPLLALVADTVEQLPPCAGANSATKPDLAGRIGYVGPADSEAPILYACLQRLDVWAWTRLAVGDAAAKAEAGAAGPKGDTGAIGPAGPQGEKGAIGETGTAGAQGVAGPSGPQGPAGPTGATGSQGPTGPQGPIGPQGAAGTPAPTAFGAAAGAGSNAVFVDADRNVGIGTTTPGAAFEMRKNEYQLFGVNADSITADPSASGWGADVSYSGPLASVGYVNGYIPNAGGVQTLLLLRGNNRYMGTNSATAMTFGFGTADGTYDSKIIHQADVGNTGYSKMIIKACCNNFGVTIFKNGSLGVGLDSLSLYDAPGAKLQVNGGLAVTSSGAVASDPGDGNLAVSGYVQLALTNGAPTSGDCDAAAERGRMKLDNATGLLWVCTNSGWASK